MALNVGKLVALFDGDVSGFLGAKERVQREGRGFDGTTYKARLDADDSPMTMSLRRAQANLARATRDAAVIQIDADIARAQARIRTLEGQRGKTKIDVDANIARAQAKIRQLEARRNVVRLNVDANAGQATAVGRRIGAAMGAAAVAGILSAGIGAAFAVAAAGAMAAGPAILGLGAAVGVTAGAMFQAGKTVKAYSDAQDAAGAASGGAAGQEMSNAIAIRDAQDGISDARRNAARVAEDTARAIAQAQDAVADAERDAAWQAEESARRIEDAQRGVADAERNLADAQRNSVRAQQAINDARRDALRDLRELAEVVSDYALSEADAELALREAQDRLREVNADYNATSLERERAALSVRQAEERLSDVVRERAADTNDLIAAERAGIDNSQRVISAREAGEAATDRVREAERSLADAHRAVGDAQRQAARDQIQSQEAVADAQQGVADAQRDAARQQADAQEQVADAVQGLNDVMAQQGQAASGGAAGVDKFAEAYAKLTPAGKAFVDQLIAMKPMMERLGDAAETAVLPGFTRLLKAGESMEPVIAHGIDAIGGSMSDTADKAAVLAASPAFQADLWKAFDNGAIVMDAAGTAVVTMTSQLVGSIARSRPAAEGFADMLEAITSGTGAMFRNAEQGMHGYGDTLRITGGIAYDALAFLGTLMANLGNNGAPMLNLVRDALRQIESGALTLSTSGLPYLQGATEGAMSGFRGGITVITSLITLLEDMGLPVMTIAGQLWALNKISFGGVQAAFSGLMGYIGREVAKGDSLGQKLGAGLKGGLVGAGITIALLAVTAIMDEIAAKNQRIKDGQLQNKQSQDDYRAAVEATNGAMTDQAEQSILGGENAKKASDNVRALNLSWDDYVRGITQGGAEASALYSEMDGKLEGLIRQSGNLYGSDKIIQHFKDLRASGQGASAVMDQISESVSYYASKLRSEGVSEEEVSRLTGLYRTQLTQMADLQGQYGGLAGSADAYRSSADGAAGATGGMSEAMVRGQSSSDTLNAAFDKLKSTSGDVASKGQAIIDMLDVLSGRQPSVEESLQSINDSIRGVADRFGEGIDKSKGFGDALVDASGRVETITSNGSALQDFLTDSADKLGAYAQSLRDAGTPAGEITEKLGAQRDAIAETLTQWGLTPDAVQKVLDYYSIVPEDISTTVSLQNSPQTMQKIQEIQSALTQLEPGVPVPVKILDADARAKLLELGYKIAQLPDKSFKVFPDTAEGQAQYDQFIASNQGTAVDFVVGANVDLANNKVDVWKQKADGTWGWVNADARTDPANGTVQAFIQNTKTGEWTWVNTDARRDPADGTVQRLIQDTKTGAWTYVNVDANPEAFWAKVNQLTRTPLSVAVSLSPVGGVMQILQAMNPGQRAKGGPVSAGMPYLVGEQGPEYIFPDRDGFVATARETLAIQQSFNTPAPQMAAMSLARAGGGGAVAGGGAVSGATVRVQLGREIDGLRADVQGLARAIADRPTVLKLDSREIARASSVGAQQNRGR
ncbi:hypothetical protein CFN78_06695 [Amycolatopsis antarctica]|uniref:Tape measure protein n=1 Tax=Amycolatopsis antarctica TaxID=1854586 RepID=A0A263D680_9PSEU|nr:hypothetical protein [Amycolatopsis antarctica]OZM73970.1 hypothetical protein CFN78_06695 [Amycolatopsis antarctica]